MSIRQRAGLTGRTLVPLIAVATLAACGSDSITAPAGVDAAAIAAASTQVNAVVNQPAMISLFAGLYGGGQVLAASPTRLANLIASSAQVAAVKPGLDANRSVRAATSAMRTIAIPGRVNYTYQGGILADSLKGRVYVRVVTQNGPQWQYDPNQSGAPANGVRFVLVSYDTTTQTFGSTVVGYLDVRDSSVSPVNRLSAIVSTPANRVVLRSHLAVTGDQSTTTDTISGTITNEQNQSVNYSAIEKETGIGTNTPRYTDDITSSLSTGAMSVTASSADGSLTAQDKQTITGTIGSTTIKLETGTIPDVTNGGFQYSDTTRISTNGGAQIGFAVFHETPTGMTLNFFNPDGSAMAQDKVDALKKFFSTVDALYGAVFVGFVVLFWLYMIGNSY